jgi:hypothetical protein
VNFFYSDTTRRGGPRQQRDQEGFGTFLQRKYEKKPKKCFAVEIITIIEHFSKKISEEIQEMFCSRNH